ncbi:hypothetical protein GCM10009409_13810 [Shewanella saliphila]|uniref:Uncharacterized protein n=1 Tax=Shewanella saliphila TaxID=2282698 RepID=A0ABQ2Q5Y1_9GAMM|nr:hypothetical protein GCM10009409_13810 [Shewanella saliphila]
MTLMAIMPIKTPLNKDLYLDGDIFCKPIASYTTTSASKSIALFIKLKKLSIGSPQIKGPVIHYYKLCALTRLKNAIDQVINDALNSF